MPTMTKKAAAKPAVRTTDPDLIPQDADVEVWRNTTPGLTHITKIGEYGKRISELIYGNRSFTLTPQERRINQSGYATDELDLFRNGTFQPVSLIDGEPDTDSLRENPNILSDRDIHKLFKTRGEAFEDRIDQVTSEAVLNRVLEIAREPRHNVTLQQYETIKLRQRALQGDPDDTAPADQDPNVTGLGKPVTPR